MYHGAEPGHFWAKLAGWILVPGAAALATRVIAPHLVKATDTDAQKMNTLMTLSGVTHALGAAGSWYASSHLFEDSVGTQAFFRGGMWSELVSTALVPASIVASDAIAKAAPAALPAGTSAPALAPAVKGLDPQSNIENLISMLTGGASKQLT